MPPAQVHCWVDHQDEFKPGPDGEGEDVPQQAQPHPSVHSEKVNIPPVSIHSQPLHTWSKILWFSTFLIVREWPKNWESFIPDIIGASKTNESLCQNNMVILKLLSEEVFDFSSGQMTQTKAKHLKDSMCSQFSEVCSCIIFWKGLFLVLKLVVFRSSPSASLSWITPTTLHWYVINQSRSTWWKDDNWKHYSQVWIPRLVQR